MDLVTFYDKNGCESLNESNEHPLSNALNTKEGFLESDCDEQVWLSHRHCNNNNNTFNKLVLFM